MVNLLANDAEVHRLLEIHEQLTGKGPGKRKMQALNKSAIVLVTAVWEAFVEDLAEAALTFMIDNAADHSVFPAKVLERVAGAHQGPNAWKLAGDGWRTAMRSNLAAVLAQTTGKLNTPRAEQVDALFDRTIGLVKLSDAWKWKGSTPTKAVGKLDKLVTLRGSIAHRVDTAGEVLKKDAEAARAFVYRLAVSSSNAVRTHVKSRTKKAPWDTYDLDW